MVLSKTILKKNLHLNFAFNTLNSKIKVSLILTPKNRHNSRECNFVKNNRKQMLKKHTDLLRSYTDKTKAAAKFVTNFASLFDVN